MQGLFPIFPVLLISVMYMCCQDFRGRGLSKWLMKTIMEYPELQGMRRWILSTADAHGLYKQFGWVPVAYPERWMEVHDREVYVGMGG